MNLNWSKFNKFKKEVYGKKVLILGLGLQGSGVGACHFFQKLGCNLRITDLKSESELAESLAKLNSIFFDRLTLGEHKEEDLDWADIIIVNPDISQNSNFLALAKKKHKFIEMETALFAELCPVPIVGVTGTRGKTTTSTLIARLLASTYPTILAGNVSGSETIMNLFEINSPAAKVILELSSFQLAGFHLKKISPPIAVFTNFYEDHLNKYPSLAEYFYDKRAIYLYQRPDDFLVINAKFQTGGFANAPCANIQQDAKGQVYFFSRKDVEGYDYRLIGEHNEENLAAALTVGKIFNLADEKIKQVLMEFGGVAYRQEIVREINDIIFINDTTATTPKAAEVALATFNSRPVILICGGHDKKCHFENFAAQAARVKKIILLNGSGTEKFKAELLRQKIEPEKISPIFNTMAAAVKEAWSVAEKGDAILLSPGFASFGMFKNEFDRGCQFNQEVAQIVP